MAIIAVSASLSLSHAASSSNELCSAFANHMSQTYKEKALREMSRKSHDFEGHRFMDENIIANNVNLTIVDYDPISLIEGDIELIPADPSEAPTGSDSGVCKFQVLMVDNPTPGMKIQGHISINYYKNKD